MSQRCSEIAKDLGLDDAELRDMRKHEIMSKRRLLALDYAVRLNAGIDGVLVARQIEEYLAEPFKPLTRP